MKTAVILFNLGGPDRPEAVRPFLENLFNDPAIIRLPGLPRRVLAWWIARQRAPVARAIYARLGGGSPLLANTQAQANALDTVLGDGYRSFVVMRYWHPRAVDQVAAVRAWAPDRIVLLPLYPQYSSTTTGSSVTEWHAVAAKAGLQIPTTSVCCYPRMAGLTQSVVDLVRDALARAPATSKPPRVLFSAHGLPRRIVEGGDPYPWQIERTVVAITAGLGPAVSDTRICYQSRVGRLEWIGPSIDTEIKQAGADGVPLVVVPISFVSEHSETLVELDVEYRHLAQQSGVPAYIRVPTVDAAGGFIASLAGIVRRVAGATGPVQSGEGGRICPAGRGYCAFGDI